MTEQEMREAEVPTFDSRDELADYIKMLVEMQHDYGTCVYAMSMAATAAFKYVAGQLGVTGFQASCADLDILRRTRQMKGPFLIIRAEDELFPQYDNLHNYMNARVEWRDWLRAVAKALLESPRRDGAHPDVVKHWEWLALSDEDQEAVL